MFTDCDSIRIEIGYRVAVQSVLYKDLRVMYVVGFTPKMVAVSPDLDTDPNKARKVYSARIAVLPDQRSEEERCAE